MPHVTGTDSGNCTGNQGGRKGKRKSNYGQTTGKNKENVRSKIKKLNDQSKKDDVVCFEELGIDRLFVDEADSYKNLYLYTKMRNVGGIAQTEAQKSSDMFMKTRYMDEVTGGEESFLPQEHRSVIQW